MSIALDATSAQASPATGWAHTCTGSNLKLVVAFSAAVSGTDNVTAVTYNGVALTKIASIQKPGDRLIDLWYLDNPSTGTHNIVPTATGFYAGVAASYTGCAPGIDSSNTGTASGASSLTTSTTVLAAGCWLVGIMGDNNASVSAGTGTTLRVPDTSNASSLVDSNGTVGTGSHALQVTAAGSNTWAGIVVSIAPAAGAAIVHAGMMLGMGM